jgi:hypothetical protein
MSSEAESGREIMTLEETQAEPLGGLILTPALQMILRPTSRIPPGIVTLPGEMEIRSSDMVLELASSVLCVIFGLIAKLTPFKLSLAYAILGTKRMVRR